MTTKCFTIEFNQIDRLSQILNRLVKIKSLESLKINCCDLDYLPDTVAELSELKILLLVDNYFIEIPSSVLELKNLEQLHMRRNKISCITPNVAQLKNLILLSLSENKITKIPNEIGELRKLQRLYLAENPISYVSSSIQNLINLEYLAVDHDIRIMSSISLFPKTVKIDMSIDTSSM